MRGGAPFGKGDGGIRRFLIDFIKVANYKKIVNDLPYSNPFIKEMVIQMRQLINHIESRRWYSNFSNTIWQANNI